MITAWQNPLPTKVAMTASTPQSLTAHLILDQLNTEGCRYLFGSNASSDSPIAAALLRSKYHSSERIKFIGALHEAIAVFMAAGYSQATSLPSVVNLVSGQGLLNAIPAIYSAYRSQTPVIILADQEDSYLLNEDPPLAVEHHKMASSVCKFMAEARTAREVCRLIRRAFHEALTPPKGPVVLSIPINLSLSTARAQVMTPPVSSPQGAADENSVAKIVKKLTESHSPCIISGNEVSQYRARKEVVLISDVLGCPVFSEPLPTGVNFPNRHPHFHGVLPLNSKEASNLLSKHDLFLLLGVQNRLPSRTDGPSLLPDNGIAIQINMDGKLAGKTLRSNLAIQADIAETLSRLRAELQLQVDKSWLKAANVRARNTISEIAEKRQKFETALNFPDPNSQTPLFWLLRILDGTRPQKSVIVSDINEASCQPFEVLSLESGSSFFSSTSGVSGYASGATMGIQWAGKDIPVICITGDESFLGYPQALWTAGHYQLNSKFIIAKTQGVHSLKIAPSAPTKKALRWQFSDPRIDLKQLAEGFGIQGESVRTFGDLEPAISRLFETKGPRLLEVDVVV